MQIDKRLRRAAGIILWKLTRHASPEDAILAAMEREPELDDSDFQLAYSWALKAIRGRQLCKEVPPETKYADVRRMADLPE